MRKDCGNCQFAANCKQQSCPALRPTPWYETPEEIEAGLEWGKRKAFLVRWVRRHMGDALSLRQQQVVAMFLLDGMSLRQIAKTTGIDRSSVCRAMRRSVIRLNRLWRDKQAGPDTKPEKRRGGKSSGAA